MSEAKFTPGPWVMRAYPTGRYGVTEHWVLDATPDVDGKVVANAICRTIETNIQSEANARLIAASPALLAALIELYDATTDGGRDKILAARAVARRAMGQAEQQQ